MGGRCGGCQRGLRMIPAVSKVLYGRNNISTSDAIDKAGKKSGAPQKSRTMMKSHCFSGGGFGGIGLRPSTRVLDRGRGTSILEVSIGFKDRKGESLPVAADGDVWCVVCGRRVSYGTSMGVWLFLSVDREIPAPYRCRMKGDVRVDMQSADRNEGKQIGRCVTRVNVRGT